MKPVWYGSRRIVMLALAARFEGLLLKSPLNARTLNAHVYGDRGTSDNPETPRSLPLIPEGVSIRFQEKRDGQWVTISAKEAKAAKSRKLIRFYIAADKVPTVIALHETRQGGVHDWQRLVSEIAKLAARIG